MTEHDHDVERYYTVDSTAAVQQKRKKGWVIWLLILAGILVLALLVATLGRNFLSKDTYAPKGPYIGVLFVEGSITSSNTDSWGIPFGYQHHFTLSKIDDLIDDTNNKGLILYVDSPGGGIFESDELYLKLVEYKELTGRPVYSYMGSMAASGGYYISAPADKIIANRNCWTGSIGVTIGTIVDISGFLENYGIKSVTITSGENKAIGSMMEPMTEEQIAILQALVDEAYEQFVTIVSVERELELDYAKEISDGRIYTASQALDLGLVDGIGQYDDAIDDMQNTYGLTDSEVVEFHYRSNSLLGRLLSQMKLPTLPGSEASAVLSLIEDDMDFPISYLSPLLN